MSDKAVALAADLAQIELTKFRFRSGGALMFLSVVVFFVGHFKPLLESFTSDFSGRAWWFSLMLLAIGAALASPEAFKAFKAVFGSTSGE